MPSLALVIVFCVSAADPAEVGVGAAPAPASAPSAPTESQKPVLAPPAQQRSAVSAPAPTFAMSTESIWVSTLIGGCVGCAIATPATLILPICAPAFGVCGATTGAGLATAALLQGVSLTDITIPVLWSAGIGGLAGVLGGVVAAAAALTIGVGLGFVTGGLLTFVGAFVAVGILALSIGVGSGVSAFIIADQIPQPAAPIKQKVPPASAPSAPPAAPVPSSSPTPASTTTTSAPTAQRF
jgi:hypothetical protein